MRENSPGTTYTDRGLLVGTSSIPASETASGQDWDRWSLKVRLATGHGTETFQVHGYAARSIRHAEAGSDLAVRYRTEGDQLVLVDYAHAKTA